MAKRIVKKIGGDRVGSGNKMTVTASGYGYSTHDVSKVRRTSMSFGTIVPMYQRLLTAKSRLRINLDALITSNALLYQLYGSAKFQVDVYSARVALYNPKMQLNLNDQGYEIADIKFPQMRLTTKGIDNAINVSNKQINKSSALAYLGVRANGQKENAPSEAVTRDHNAMWLLMYYQIGKEYYANKQEKKGVMIHNATYSENVTVVNFSQSVGEDGTLGKFPVLTSYAIFSVDASLDIDHASDANFDAEKVELNIDGVWINATNVFTVIANPNTTRTSYYSIKEEYISTTDGNHYLESWRYAVVGDPLQPQLKEYDLKAIDRMMMKIMSQVETPTALIIDENSEFPYCASFKRDNNQYSINTTQEGLLVGTYQSDVFNNWLDNATINNLNNRSKVKIDPEGNFSIDLLNITQKLYNYDMRIGITDGTLDEWREVTYGDVGKSKSLKPVYEGGLSKEIRFDMIVSTASTEEDPLGTIASRGTFGAKHKGGYVQIDTDEEKMVLVVAKITPRIVYNQGNDYTTNLKTLDDLHKPEFDKIGYQNLITDQIVAEETVVKADGTLITYSAGKQPAWQWYRTDYDDALGNMADTEDYKVFGRSYAMEKRGVYYRIKDLTTYIDPTLFNDVFAIQSLDAMNFDVQVGIDAQLTLVMSEEVIPGIN